MQIHRPQKEGCRKGFVSGSDAARFANCSIANPPQTLPLSLPQPSLPEVANVPQSGRGFDFCHQNVHCTYLPSNSVPMLCSFRWICIFSGRTSCDFSGRTSPILRHHQKQTPEDFFFCHLGVRAGSPSPTLLYPFWGQLQ